MKHFISIGLILVIINSSFSQQGWVQQSSGTTFSLNNLQFTSSTTGFVTGNGSVLLKTTNSGSNWAMVYAPTGALGQIQYLNASTGYLLVNNDIYKTINTGVNWNAVTASNAGGIFYFLDVNTGFCAAGSGGFGKTTNGGANWSSPVFVTIGGLTGLVYFSDTQIILPGWYWTISPPTYTAKIYFSSNGGANWSEAYSSLTGSYSAVKGISFPNSTRGFAVGIEASTKYFYTSATNGHTWTKSTIPVEMDELQFIDNNTGWLVGANGMIYYTTNGGANFVTQASGVTNNLKKIYMLNALTGWIVGEGGVILSTTNGGVSGLQQISGTVPQVFSLSQNYPNPFNPKTVINFQVASEKFIKLIVYDALGKEIESIVNQQLSPGTYQADWDGTNFPSGVYFYQLITNDELIATKKMVLLK